MNREEFIASLRHEDRFIVQTIADCIDNEGWSYSDSPSDLGGATGFGLSARYNPSLRTAIISQSLTAQVVFDTYKKKYYYPSGAHIAHRDGMNGIAALIFECRVTGHRDVVRALQMSVNEVLATKLVCDGKYGGKTNSALLQSILEGKYKLVMERLNKKAGFIGARAANRVMEAQRSQGIAVYDYTNGFRNRIERMVGYAVQAKFA